MAFKPRPLPPSDNHPDAEVQCCHVPMQKDSFQTIVSMRYEREQWGCDNLLDTLDDLWNIAVRVVQTVRGEPPKRARGKMLTAEIDREIVWSPNRLGESNPINVASQL